MSDHLQRMLGMSNHLLTANLEGLTHEESLVEPEPHGNGANWTLGHIVFWRDDMLGLVGAERVWGADAHQEYDTAPWSPETALPWDELLAAARTTHDRLAAALAETPEPECADRLFKLLMHEQYHVGQIGLLRRIAGKPGALAR